MNMRWVGFRKRDETIQKVGQDRHGQWRKGRIVLGFVTSFLGVHRLLIDEGDKQIDTSDKASKGEIYFQTKPSLHQIEQKPYSNHWRPSQSFNSSLCACICLVNHRNAHIIHLAIN